jgi:hypothetical protein
MRKLIFGIGVVVLAGRSQAGTITSFTDRGTFDTSVGVTATETFGPVQCFPLTAPLNSASSYACLSAGTIQPGATYSAPVVAGNSFNIDAGGGFPTPFLDSLLLGRGSAPLTVTFDSPVSAVGFDTDEVVMGDSFSILFNFISGSSSLTPSLASNSNLQFFGFESSAADIQSVTITGTDTLFGFGLDNFSFNGNASAPVPEPATFPLISLALVLFAGTGKLARSRSRH